MHFSPWVYYFKVARAEDRLRLEKGYALTLPTKEGVGAKQRRGYTWREVAKLCFRLAHHGLQAEVFAILMVASREEAKGVQSQEYICSDSQAALRAVSAPRTRSALVQECGDALEELARHKEVILVGVPGHSAVPGNEKADELARLGSEDAAWGPEPYLGITRQQVTAALNDWVYSTLKEHWRLSIGCRQARDFVPGPTRPGPFGYWAEKVRKAQRENRKSIKGEWTVGVGQKGPIGAQLPGTSRPAIAIALLLRLRSTLGQESEKCCN
ncbi:hypothetical protein NQ317_011074, partial [Molorchus minor]